MVLRVTGRDPTLCPECGRGHLQVVQDLAPFVEAGLGGEIAAVTLLSRSPSRYGPCSKVWERCASCRTCGTMKETKSLWEEPDAGDKPFEEALTRREHLVSGALSAESASVPSPSPAD